MLKPVCKLMYLDLSSLMTGSYLELHYISSRAPMFAPKLNSVNIIRCAFNTLTTRLRIESSEFFIITVKLEILLFKICDRVHIGYMYALIKTSPTRALRGRCVTVDAIGNLTITILTSTDILETVTHF